MRTKYTDAQKREICAAWALSGDDADIAQRYGVHAVTIKKWRKTAWWRDCTLALNDAHGSRLIAKANKALDTALDELDDRLHRGDLKVSLVRGEPVEYRQPVPARDLSAIVNVLANRSERAAKLAQAQETNYQLSDLQGAFREFAKSYRTKSISDMTAINGESESIDTQLNNSE
jgi:hypothetical protein